MRRRRFLLAAAGLAAVWAGTGGAPAAMAAAPGGDPTTVAQAQQSSPPKPDPAAAATPATREAAARLAGSFSLTSADGERRCAFALKTDAAGAAFVVAFDREACAPLGFALQVAAWLPDPSGSIRLLNAQGRTLAEFTEASGGSYEALREGDGVYFLTSPDAVDEASVSIDEVSGEWVLSRVAGTPVCRWTLTDEAYAKGGSVVRMAAGCDVSLLRFAPVAWRIEGGNILVRGDGDGTSIRFARQEDGTWARVPERGRPLLMTRP